MRERVERLVGGVSRLMWVMTFHSACARILRTRRRAARLQARLHDLRRGRLAADGQALHGGARARPQAVPAARDQGPDLRRQEPAGRRPSTPRAPRLLLRGDRRRRLRAVREADARGERDGLRRPARPHRQPASSSSRTSASATSALPLRPRRRVPGHEPRPVPAAAARCARSTATCSSSATTSSRSTASAAPTSATSSTSSATSPRRRS